LTDTLSYLLNVRKIYDFTSVKTLAGELTINMVDSSGFCTKKQGLSVILAQTGIQN